MRLRDWIDPGTADILIPLVGLLLLATPLFGAAIGSGYRDYATGSRKRGIAIGLGLGCIVSCVCLVANRLLVLEYWAG